MSNRLLTNDTGQEILAAIKQQNAIIAKGSAGLKMESYDDLLSLVREGLAPEVLSPGDVIEVGKATSLTASLGVHEGVTAVSFISTTGQDTFISAMGEAGEKEYEIVYDGSAWKYENEPIILADYGLQVTGTAAAGDTIVVVETGTVIKMAVMDFIENGQTTIGNIKLHDSNKKFGMILQSLESLYDMQFDVPEAFFYNSGDSAMSAGTYNVTLGDSYDTSYGGGKTYQFTLTQALPVGGQLVFDWPYQKTPLQGSGVKSYASGSDATPIETATVTEGDGGTSLGTMLIEVQAASALNSLHRIRYGSNRWKTSAMRQHLNSAGAGGSVWTPQTPWDRPPSWVSSTAGFKYRLDPEFVKICADVELLTALSTAAGDTSSASATAGTGNEVTVDKFFLPSRPEVYGGGDNNSDKGNPWVYYSANSDLGAAGGGADTNRIKTNPAGTAKVWWLRSPGVGYGGYVRFVMSDGNVGVYYASYGGGVAPACVVA